MLEVEAAGSDRVRVLVSDFGDVTLEMNGGCGRKSWSDLNSYSVFAGAGSVSNMGYGKPTRTGHCGVKGAC